jgi:predicted amidohydrolase
MCKFDRDIRIAAVVCRCPVGQIELNFESMCRWVEAAKEQGAHIVCFPEMNISGYSIQPRTADSAQSIDAPVVEQLRQLAQTRDLTILGGMAELDRSGAACIAHLVAVPGKPVEIYRKLHLSPHEKEVFRAGDQVPIFEAYGLRFGIQLCYDAHFPELATRMALEGAHAIFIPHASPRGSATQKYNSWLRHLPARAYDNGLYVIALNQSGDNGEGLFFPGLAVVVGPGGEIQDHMLTDGEAMLIADLSARDLQAVRDHRMRYFLPNRRPDIYGS